MNSQKSKQWLIYFGPLVSVRDPPYDDLVEPLEGVISRFMYSVQEELGWEISSHCIYSGISQAADLNVPYGSILHMHALMVNTNLCFQNFYMDACSRDSTVSKILVIAYGSGVYLALRAIHFYSIYRKQFRSSSIKELLQAWTRFLRKPPSEELVPYTEMTLIAIQPSLPRYPRCWSWLRPVHYRVKPPRISHLHGHAVMLRLHGLGLDDGEHVETTGWGIFPSLEDALLKGDNDFIVTLMKLFNHVIANEHLQDRIVDEKAVLSLHHRLIADTTDLKVVSAIMDYFTASVFGSEVC